jgi:phytoene/squalene synthetase
MEQRTRHGLNRQMARIKLKGLGVIDRRTAAARELLQWRAQLLTDLGGEDSISAQRRALVETAARTKAIIDHVDAFLLSLGSLVNKRKRSLYPVVAQRQSLCDSLSRLLGQLGLERIAKRVPSLQEYIAAKESKESEKAS